MTNRTPHRAPSRAPCRAMHRAMHRATHRAMYRAPCRATGFTLAELMVAVALLGTVVIASTALLPGAWREADLVVAEQEAFDARWHALERLRADVERATTARIDDDALILSLPDGGTIRWSRTADGLTRELTSDRPDGRNVTRVHAVEAAPSPFALRRESHGTLVSWTLGREPATLRGLALVGARAEHGP